MLKARGELQIAAGLGFGPRCALATQVWFATLCTTAGIGFGGKCCLQIILPRHALFSLATSAVATYRSTSGIVFGGKCALCSVPSRSGSASLAMFAPATTKPRTAALSTLLPRSGLRTQIQRVPSVDNLLSHVFGPRDVSTRAYFDLERRFLWIVWRCRRVVS